MLRILLTALVFSLSVMQDNNFLQLLLIFHCTTQVTFISENKIFLVTLSLGILNFFMTIQQSIYKNAE